MTNRTSRYPIKKSDWITIGLNERVNEQAFDMMTTSIYEPPKFVTEFNFQPVPNLERDKKLTASLSAVSYIESIRRSKRTPYEVLQEKTYLFDIPKKGNIRIAAVCFAHSLILNNKRLPIECLHDLTKGKTDWDYQHIHLYSKSPNVYSYETKKHTRPTPSDLHELARVITFHLINNKTSLQPHIIYGKDTILNCVHEF